MPSRNTIKKLDTVKTRKEFLPSLVVVTVQVAWMIMGYPVPMAVMQKRLPKDPIPWSARFVFQMPHVQNEPVWT